MVKRYFHNPDKTSALIATLRKFYDRNIDGGNSDSRLRGWKSAVSTLGEMDKTFLTSAQNYLRKHLKYALAREKAGLPMEDEEGD